MLVALFTMPVWASKKPTPATITITDAWAPPSLSLAAGVAYVTVKNTGAADAMLRVEAKELTPQAELHTHIKDEDDVLRMRKLEQLDIPAQSTVAMQPGADHIMLIGLNMPMVEAGQFTLVCYFKHHAPITTRVKIDKARLLAYIKSRNTQPQH